MDEPRLQSGTCRPERVLSSRMLECQLLIGRMLSSTQPSSRTASRRQLQDRTIAVTVPTTAHIQTIPRQSPLGAWHGSGYSETDELTNDGTMSRSRVWPWGSRFTW
eukprot:2379666-Rhodomonas_salina.1